MASWPMLGFTKSLEACWVPSLKKSPPSMRAMLSSTTGPGAQREVSSLLLLSFQPGQRCGPNAIPGSCLPGDADSHPPTRECSPLLAASLHPPPEAHPHGCTSSWSPQPGSPTWKSSAHGECRKAGPVRGESGSPPVVSSPPKYI